MKEDIDHLVLTYLNDEASDAEAEILFTWVREKPDHASKFARACALHAHLREHFGGQHNIRGAGSQPVELPTPRSGKRKGRFNWDRRLAAMNQFLVAAVLLMVLQMSLGALTLLELCRSPDATATVPVDRPMDKSSF